MNNAAITPKVDNLLCGDIGHMGDVLVLTIEAVPVVPDIIELAYKVGDRVLVEPGTEGVRLGDGRWLVPMASVLATMPPEANQ